MNNPERITTLARLVETVAEGKFVVVTVTKMANAQFVVIDLAHRHHEFVRRLQRRHVGHYDHDSGGAIRIVSLLDPRGLRGLRYDGIFDYGV